MKVVRFRRSMKTYKLVQAGLKRCGEILLQRRREAGLLRLQRFGRWILRQQQNRKWRVCRSNFLKSLDCAWMVILNRRALLIQKNYRGYAVRKRIGKQKLR